MPPKWALIVDAFDYEAVDAGGKTTRGTVMATSARAARRELRARALTPIQMSAANTAPTKVETKSAPRKKVKLKTLTQATRQLAILIKADTPVAEALKITALQFEGSPMRQSLLDVRTQILEGRRLSEALSEDKRTYSQLYRSMVAAGENAGQLGSVLERLAGDLESAQKMRRKVLGATVYPLVLSVVAIAVIVILMVFVVPKVVEQFSSLGQNLPPLTRMTIALSEWLQAYGLWLLLAIAVFIFGFLQAMRSASFRRRIDGVILKLPYIGKLSRDMNAARFARTMGGLLDSGTPVLPAIDTAKNTLKNAVMRDAAETIVEQVRGGSSLGAALKGAAVFPPLMMHMIAGGEASGDLGEMFAVSADYLESEFESSTTIVLNLLEPMIIVLLGGVVLLIVAAIFMPILKLNTMAF